MFKDGLDTVHVVDTTATKETAYFASGAAVETVLPFFPLA